MNTLNRFSNLDEDYYEGDNNVNNSFKPLMKSTTFKKTDSVQDTATTAAAFKLDSKLFPTLTKSAKSVSTSVVAYSKLLTTTEEMKDTKVEEEEKEKEKNVRDVNCFIAVFNKKTRALHVYCPPQKATAQNKEEQLQADLLKNAAKIVNKLNKLHIRRSDEYLLNWGEDEYIRTFLSERDVESAPVFLKHYASY